MDAVSAGRGKELRALAARAAASSTSGVLVLAGAGAPVLELAREVHALSTRASRPFVHVRCTLEPEDPSAALARAGDGTLFLECVERLGPAAQETLARKLGDARERRGGARVIASLTGDPGRLAGERRLREDLLYRLNGLSLELTPLRERPTHALELARETLARVAPQVVLAPSAERAIETHDWPGNEREVELTLERAALLVRDGPLEASALFLRPRQEVQSGPLFSTAERSLRAVEEALIRQVLAEQGGNRSAAARVLGLHRATLHLKLRALGPEPR